MANFTNKRRFVHEADKKRLGEQDTDQKAKVSRIMKYYFGLACVYHDLFVAIHKKHHYLLKTLSKKQVESGEFWPHKPDLMVTNWKRLMLIEIDGEYHFFTGRGVKQTNLRNDHYEKAKVDFIWLTSQDVQNTETILVEILKEKLIRYGIKLKPKD